MATRRKDPWEDWGRGMAGLVQSGQRYSASSPLSIAAQNAPQAAWPDPGTYDPAFDINADNARLGFFRYGQDFARDWGELGAGASGGRMGTDLQTALSRGSTTHGWNRSDVQTQNWRANEDINRQRTRGLADFATTGTRMREDYDRSIAGLLRNYSRLAGNQAQTMRAAGVAGGGATAQAARKRAANQAWDRQPIDTGYQRGTSDLARDRTRFTEDLSTQQERVNYDARNTLGRLDTQAGWGYQDTMQGYQRGREDAITGYGRTENDLQNYLTGQAALAYHSSGQIQPPGVSLLELLRRRSGR